MLILIQEDKQGRASKAQQKGNKESGDGKTEKMEQKEMFFLLILRSLLAKDNA